MVNAPETETLGSPSQEAHAGLKAVILAAGKAGHHGRRRAAGAANAGRAQHPAMRGRERPAGGSRRGYLCSGRLPPGGSARSPGTEVQLCRAGRGAGHRTRGVAGIEIAQGSSRQSADPLWRHAAASVPTRFAGCSIAISCGRRI